MNTIVKIARELNVKAPATIVVGEVVTVLHGRRQGLLSDASEGMFRGVDAEKVERAAAIVAEKAQADFGVVANGNVSADTRPPSPRAIAGR